MRYVMNNTRIGNRAQSLISRVGITRNQAVAGILMVSLCAFEIFNFDTTRYALRDLLGDVQFMGMQWAGILALAFCSIDFAGLIRLFTPERGKDEPREVWYLMGAWLLGATMNAAMTWWAISLTLLNHQFGNEVLSREELLTYVPVFVAVLVWLTRILFIGAFTVAGERLMDEAEGNRGGGLRKRPSAPAQPTRTNMRTGYATQARQPMMPMEEPEPAMPQSRAPMRPTATPRPKPASRVQTTNGRSTPTTPNNPPEENARVKRRPPTFGGGNVRRVYQPRTARSRNKPH